jgi:hypothetical protein
MSIVRASSVLSVSLLIGDNFLVAPNVCGPCFFGKIPIVLYCPVDRAAQRFARGVPPFSAIPARSSLHARHSPIRR